MFPGDRWIHLTKDHKLFLKSWFQLTTTKPSKLYITGPLCRESTSGFPAQRASNAEHASMSRCHHEISLWYCWQTNLICFTFEKYSTQLPTSPTVYTKRHTSKHQQLFFIHSSNSSVYSETHRPHYVSMSCFTQSCCPCETWHLTGFGIHCERLGKFTLQIFNSSKHRKLTMEI